MKLSNLSLAILVAVGVAACGGSDNNDAPKDPDAGKTPGGNVTPTPPTPPTPPAPKDPNASAPVSNEKNATVVDPASVESVKAAKQVNFTRAARDLARGYNGRTPNNRYEDGATDNADLLRNGAIVNYLKEGVLRNDGTLRLNPLYTYARGTDGRFYRVARVNGTGATWSNATVDSTFQIVGAGTTPNTPGVTFAKFNAGMNVPASELVYIPNAMAGLVNNSDIPTATNTTANAAAYVPVAGELGNLFADNLNTAGGAGINILNPRAINYANNSEIGTNEFDINREMVDIHTLNFAGEKYDISRLGSQNHLEIKMDGIPVKQEVQKLPITLDYTVIDGKGTLTAVDDEIFDRTAKAGLAKVYNLNYSRAMVTVNEAAAKDPSASNARSRNTLGMATTRQGYNGQWQVVGRQTGTLPDNGRAVYTGKSFGVNSEGTIKLEADFGIDRASISGSVYDRKGKLGEKDINLPDWKLHEILLSQPGQYKVTGSSHFNGGTVAPDARVSAGGVAVGSWAVQLYGANAENAAGFISRANPAAPGGTSLINDTNIVEAFGSARGDIQPKSLNN